MLSSTLSAYELQRLENIKENEAALRGLGLDSAAQGVRTAPVARKARKRPAETERPPPPRSSRSSRSRGPPPEFTDVPADLDDRTEEGVEGTDLRNYAEPLKRPSNLPRLTAEQSAKLDGLETVSAAPLTDAEVDALRLAREDLVEQRTGNWQVHTKKGTSLYGEKRAILAASAPARGLRWPTWLSAIEAALPPMGTTQSARDQTMFAIERAACGLGLDYKAWPEGVGVLLARDAAAAGAGVRPRVLTLGSDTEVLRREGQRLEHRFGRDAGNGWAYNHALNKLRAYQELLLREKWADAPSDRSIAELEADGERPGDGAAEGEGGTAHGDAAADAEANEALVNEALANEASDSASTSARAAALPFTRAMVASAMAGSTLEALTAKMVREALEAELGMDKGALKPFKAELLEYIDQQILKQSSQ